MYFKYFTNPATLLIFGLIITLWMFAWKFRKTQKSLKIKVANLLELNLPYCILYILLSILLTCWLHDGAQKWAISYLEKTPTKTGGNKPKFISKDEHMFFLGLGEYNLKRYDMSLKYFSDIGSLSGPLYVKWKFYETMSQFRIEQYRKSIMLSKPNAEAVENIKYRLESLLKNNSNDVMYQDIKYFYAHTLYFLLDNHSESLNLFQELIEEYKNDRTFRWQEGARYYCAKILLANNKQDNKLVAKKYLIDLWKNFENGVIQVIESGKDVYSVRFMITNLVNEYDIDTSDFEK